MNKQFLVILMLLGIVLGSCNPSAEQHAETKPVVNNTEAQISRGAYLVGIIGCGDCHSPKVFTEFGPSQDPARALSGHPAELPLGPVDKAALSNWALFGMHNTVAVGPWGASFAANITSDATGIGGWSYDQFRTAMTKGKYKGLENARNLLPPMPWPNYAQLSEEDLQAIFAYLKSTPPVRNVVPAAIGPDQLSYN